MKKILALLLTITFLGAQSLWASSKTVSLTEESTLIIWRHHIEAWEQRNLEAIVAAYDSESILILNGHTYRGPDEIKLVFERLFRIFDNAHNQIDPAVVDGRIVYITWHFTSPHFQGEFGSDTFVIEDNKIKIQTIASPIYNGWLH